MDLSAPLRRVRNTMLQTVGLRPAPPTPAWPLEDNPINVPKIQHQLQSPLFGKLSAELRIPIYYDVLGDTERFLHICLNAGKRRRPVAHWRCTDTESPYPTWQHECFGERSDPDAHRSTFTTREITTTDNMLIALLLSCRRLYSETLAILYEQNIFHFRGGLTLPLFKQSIPTAQWNAIRHIHISTAYLPFYVTSRGSSIEPFFRPPETLPNWPRICEDLSSLPNLQTLSFDILAKYEWRTYSMIGRSSPSSTLTFLEPLKAVHAESMSVELDIKIPEEVLQCLGPINYEIQFRIRDSNHMYDYVDQLSDSIRIQRIHYPSA